MFANDKQMDVSALWFAELNDTYVGVEQLADEAPGPCKAVTGLSGVDALAEVQGEFAAVVSAVLVSQVADVGDQRVDLLLSVGWGVPSPVLFEAIGELDGDFVTVGWSGPIWTRWRDLDCRLVCIF